MSSTSAPRPTGIFRYGIEAPYVPLAIGAGTVVAFVLAAVLRSWVWVAVGVVLLAQVVIFLNATTRGKLTVWERELDRMGLCGDERLLDLGCGRGAVLVAAAQRLPRGTAEGVDLWRSKDQSGNTMETAQANADAAGVGERVRLHTGDLRALPFPDGSFDVVTSALAIHNIPSADDRERAIAEALRVLKAGGRLVIADIAHAKDYAEQVRPAALEVQLRGLGPNYWYAGPWMAASMVTAVKR